MEAVSADTAGDAPVDRRGLLGLAGVAGLAGAAAVALLADGSVGASPNAPTDADIELLTAAMEAELAVRDLYRARLEVGAGDITDVVSVMGENHEAYAQAIAGACGLSAQGRNDDLYDANVDAFQSGRTTFATAAHELEQTLVATHTSLLEQYESADAVTLTASILVVEARHATVLADLLGVTDPAVLFGNEQSPADLTGGAA